MTNKQMTTRQTIVFIIVIAIAVFVNMQVVNGQNTSSSMVDKLIQDTKKNQTTDQSYRAELVNKLTIESDCMPKDYQQYMPFMTIPQLESQLKFCVNEGIIK